MSTHTVKSELKSDIGADAQTQSLSARLTWQIAIAFVLFTTFCLGFPQFHYTAALMIAAILRYKDTPGDIFAPYFALVRLKVKSHQVWVRCVLLFALLSLSCAAAQSSQANLSDARVGEAAHYEAPSATQLQALPGETWSAQVDGLRLRYHLVSLEGFSSLGYFVFTEETQTCHIYIDTWLANHASRAEHLAVVFHEVGHCVDAVTLRFSHNAFLREGCAYGAYYCAPAEGYAEAWRYAYGARCGLNAVAIGYEPVLASLGYSAKTSAPSLERCTLPTAEGVLPPLFAEQLATTY